MSKSRVEVVIDGQIITLVSDESESYLQEVARYIDKKLTELKSSKSSRPVSESLRMMHIAANIADDYFKTLYGKQELEDVHEAYINEMAIMQEENLLLRDRISDLQAQLALATKQFKEELASLGIIEKPVDEVKESSDYEGLRKEFDKISKDKRRLEKQLKEAKYELEEYISTFDERDEKDEKDNIDDKAEPQNVLSFTRLLGGHDHAE